ncbi:unnamed protein product [Zymoseptoria tritici ST99CH_1A5]|uniref:Uncharacterized protein n=3 Tax=Zymoseptoria tritici TaxID=1047171 RepID=A0A1X7RKL6_ZYMT9|nr:unnamed protein product [Zymoseptoria tritici ST99CH_3D7]SMR46499.1 unnamed protein product [Zymoseptoria tritici ST99CH_1E4]SMR47742.1 unnamed protein product [Zymoseptoria tritici ST99CH_3D1]SMY21645.1 unnamed protein product [Zymoseptoria tritici ST99CH_1A5]
MSYLISRAIDPIFAMSVGAAAVVVRVNREEKEKGRTTEETIASLKRRTASLFEKAPESEVKKSVERAG